MEIKTIGGRIKEIRRFHKVSQVEFAKRLCVTKAYISRLEKGITMPSEPLMKLICIEFEINIDWLKRGEGFIITDDAMNRAHQQLTFLEAASPLLDWMRQNGEPYTNVIINMEKVVLVNNKMQFSFSIQ